MKKKRYFVWNNMDDISTHQGFFDSKKEAEEFIDNFVKRYEPQGYYRNNNWDKISLKELKSYLEIIEEATDKTKDFIQNRT